MCVPLNTKEKGPGARKKKMTISVGLQAETHMLLRSKNSTETE